MKQLCYAVLVTALAVTAHRVGFGQSVERVSVPTGGGESNAASFDPVSVSADGRYVAFFSDATNLVPGDGNGATDMFVRDRLTGTTLRVSVGTGGTEANGASTSGRISADGRFVAFTSSATNLVAGDTNGTQDVFVHEMSTGTTTRVSVATGGGEANGFSFTGPGISGDGRFVAFASIATNLVAGDTNGIGDIFLHDRQTTTTTRVSVATGGAQATGFIGSQNAAISANGSFVAFVSDATNLVAGDTNGENDVFVHDVTTVTTTRASVATGGGQADDFSMFPALSGDGRFVAFYSNATNLDGPQGGPADIYVHDRQVGTTVRASVASGGAAGNGDEGTPSISGDGRFVAWSSGSTNLIASDSNGVTSDVYLHDLSTGTTKIVGLAPDGSQGNDIAFGAAINEDGSTVAYSSSASNLVAVDTNGVADVFVVSSPLPPAAGGVGGGNDDDDDFPFFGACSAGVAGRGPATALAAAAALVIVMLAVARRFARAWE